MKRGSVAAHRIPDKRARKEANKEADGRRRAALEAVERERQRLEARLAREAVEPAVGPVPGAEWKPPEVSAQEVVIPARPRMKLPPEDAEGTEWTMGQARQMLRQGYHIYRVQQVTGWGAKWLDDIELDPDGFGLPL